MEPEWAVSLKVGTSRDPLPTAMLSPPVGPQSPKTMPPDRNQACMHLSLSGKSYTPNMTNSCS